MKNDGGPVFSYLPEEWIGMSLRALIAMVVFHGYRSRQTYGNREETARAAVADADALIAELEKRT